MKTNLTSARGSLDEVERLIDEAKSSILDTVSDLERVIAAHVVG